LVRIVSFPALTSAFFITGEVAGRFISGFVPISVRTKEMRLKRILIIGTIFPVLFSIILFFGILTSGEDDDSSNSYSPVYSGMNLAADVLKHQPMVEKYARENGYKIE